MCVFHFVWRNYWCLLDIIVIGSISFRAFFFFLLFWSNLITSNCNRNQFKFNNSGPMFSDRFFCCCSFLIISFSVLFMCVCEQIGSFYMSFAWEQSAFLLKMKFLGNCAYIELFCEKKLYIWSSKKLEGSIFGTFSSHFCFYPSIYSLEGHAQIERPFKHLEEREKKIEKCQHFCTCIRTHSNYMELSLSLSFSSSLLLYFSSSFALFLFLFRPFSLPQFLFHQASLRNSLHVLTLAMMIRSMAVFIFFKLFYHLKALDKVRMFIHLFRFSFAMQISLSVSFLSEWNYNEMEITQLSINEKTKLCCYYKT